MANRKTSASRNAPFTKTISRDKIKGGRGRGRRSRPLAALPLLLGRLRRLELGVLHLCGEYPDFDLDSFSRAVLALETDAEIEKSWRPVRRGEVQIPYEGPAPGQGERTAQDVERLEDRHQGPPPFAPGPPVQDEEE